MATDHDNLQYERMRECLLGFRAGTMKLADLIEELPQMVKNLEQPDPNWKAEFVGHWWTLEEIHGDAIDLGESRRMPEGSRSTVEDAIDGLDRLVNGALTRS